MGIKLGDLSPVYGAIKGEGMFGDLIGKKSQLAAEAKAEEEKKNAAAAQGPAGTQTYAGQGMKKGGKVKGWGMARGARKAKTY